ncbi:hypothetical protein CEXT_248091 [Caerostris extrusa]|uniref:Ig-like domain-containing protein n=1 Tax=Caerostris extrusa TaxID=172846 RepID=A0AAV4XT91_CAEEX|nr:hypothetical protein CEXT_248091 [Caerostris extrusa]
MRLSCNRMNLQSPDQEEEAQHDHSSKGGKYTESAADKASANNTKVVCRDLKQYPTLQSLDLSSSISLHSSSRRTPFHGPFLSSALPSSFCNNSSRLLSPFRVTIWRLYRLSYDISSSASGLWYLRRQYPRFRCSFLSRLHFTAARTASPEPNRSFSPSPQDLTDEVCPQFDDGVVVTQSLGREARLSCIVRNLGRFKLKKYINGSAPQQAGECMFCKRHR